MVITYNIFGKKVQFQLLGNEKQVQTFTEQFSLYSLLENNDHPDLKIIIGGTIHKDILSINPKIHHEIKNGFRGLYPKILVEYKYDDIFNAHIVLEKKKNSFIEHLKKLNNIQFSSIDERLAQIIYELVLVPSVYFDNQKFLVHSSAFKKSNGGAILIGGTGGVGKTSLEIELCMNHGFSFISDDISVVDVNSNIWPNLSFPKIYAYNLKNNPILNSRIFSKRSLYDKFAWKLKHFLNGPSGVRRTISPVDAYGSYEKKETKIEKYYILNKRNVKEISCEKIDSSKAAAMSLYVMQTEYFSFNNHVLWHEFNCEVLNSNPILNLHLVLNRWLEESEKVFSKIDCYLINIPFNIDHKEFTKIVGDLIA